MKKFEIQRADGRSNSEVVLDLVKGGEPGTVYEYEELARALEAGVNRSFSRQAVQAIVMGLYSRLLKEQGRALHCVRGTGYRLAPASLHTKLASQRRSRADKQMKRGLDTLRNVRWDELTENERMAHEGQLMIQSAIWSQVQALERRQTAVEEVLQKALRAPTSRNLGTTYGAHQE